MVTFETLSGFFTEWKWSVYPELQILTWLISVKVYKIKILLWKLWTGHNYYAGTGIFVKMVDHASLVSLYVSSLLSSFMVM